MDTINQKNSDASPEYDNETIYAYFEHFGLEYSDSTPCIVWAHGWGQNSASFEKIYKLLEKDASHLLIDFPGFGNSKNPPTSWGTKEYALDLAKVISKIPSSKIIYVGHSFGCRIGVQLASLQPEKIDSLVLVSAAGLKKPSHICKKFSNFLRISAFKIFKAIYLKSGGDINKLYSKVGSVDYRNSGKLRQIFVTVVNENLIDESKKVNCPTILLYGEKDTETPVSIGKLFSVLIPNSEFKILKNLDHYSILTDGRYLIVKVIKNYLT